MCVCVCVCVCGGGEGWWGEGSRVIFPEINTKLLNFLLLLPKPLVGPRVDAGWIQ